MYTTVQTFGVTHVTTAQQNQMQNQGYFKVVVVYSADVSEARKSINTAERAAREWLFKTGSVTISQFTVQKGMANSKTHSQFSQYLAYKSSATE